MIISKDGYAMIKGKGIDILEDYTLIAQAVLHTDPEMFIAIHTVFAEEAIDLFSELDEKKLSYFIKRAEEIARETKERGGKE